MDLYKLEVTLIDRKKELQINLDNLSNLRLNEENLKEENNDCDSNDVKKSCDISNNVNESLLKETDNILLNYSNLYLNNSILENIGIKDQGKFPDIISIDKSTEKNDNNKNFKNLKAIFNFLSENKEGTKFKNIIIKELNNSDEFFIEFIHVILFLHLSDYTSILGLPDIFEGKINNRREFIYKLLLNNENGLYNILKKSEKYMVSLKEFESTLKYFRTKVDPWIKMEKLQDNITGGATPQFKPKEQLKDAFNKVKAASRMISDSDPIIILERMYNSKEIIEERSENLIQTRDLFIYKNNYKSLLKFLSIIIDRYNNFYNEKISIDYKYLKENLKKIKNDLAILNKINKDNNLKLKEIDQNELKKPFKDKTKDKPELTQYINIVIKKLEKISSNDKNHVNDIIQELIQKFEEIKIVYDKKIDVIYKNDVKQKAAFDAITGQVLDENLIEVENDIINFRNILELFIFIIYKDYINYLDTILNKFIKFREKVQGSSIAKINTTNYLYTRNEITKILENEKKIDNIDVKNSILNSNITYRTYIINFLKFFKKEYDLNEIKKDINSIFKIESGDIQNYYKNFLNTEESKKKQKYIFTKIIEDRNKEDTHYDRSKYRLNTESGFDQIIREYYKYLYKDKQVKDLRNIEKINIITLYNVLFILKEIYLKDNTILIIPVNNNSKKFYIKNIDIDFTNKDTNFFKVDNNSKLIKILLKFDSEVISEFSSLEIYHYFEDIEELLEENIKTSINSLKPEDINIKYKKYKEIYITDTLKLDEINFNKFIERSDVKNQINEQDEIFFNKNIFLLLDAIYKSSKIKKNINTINVELLNNNIITLLKNIIKLYNDKYLKINDTDYKIQNTSIINFNYSNTSDIKCFNFGLNINQDLIVSEKLKQIIKKFIKKNQEEYKYNITNQGIDIQPHDNEDKIDFNKFKEKDKNLLNNFLLKDKELYFIPTKNKDVRIDNNLYKVLLHFKVYKVSSPSDEISFKRKITNNLCLDRAKYLDEAFLNVIYNNFDIPKDYLVKKLIKSNFKEKKEDKKVEVDKNVSIKRDVSSFKGGNNRKTRKKNTK